jgi:TonB family protein
MYLRLTSLIFSATLVAIGLTFPAHGELQGSENPKVIESKTPVYPAIAVAAHASGTVVVDLEIDANGKVSLAKVNRGHPLLAAVSRNAAMNWRFDSSPNREAKRSVSLTFDYDPSACTGRSLMITPYHLRIEPEPILTRPPDTVSYIPADSRERFCPVHKTRLLRDRVEIAYGLIGFKTGYEEAEKKLFPKANLEVLGGCVVEMQINCDGTQVQSSPKYAEVLYCPACRRAQARWSKTHP